MVSVSAGADPNRQTRAGGSTALHRAAYMGHLQIVDLLCAPDSTSSADGTINEIIDLTCRMPIDLVL